MVIMFVKMVLIGLHVGQMNVAPEGFILLQSLVCLIIAVILMQGDATVIIIMSLSMLYKLLRKAIKYVEHFFNVYLPFFNEIVY